MNRHTGTGYDPTAYGAAIADVYDDLYPDDVMATGATVRRLLDLAGDGPVLELGVGTGRLALPLAAAGLRVHGIDASQEMLDRLDAKRGSSDIEATLGDFSSFEVPGRFALAVLVFNTIFALPDQDAQVRCFECVAAHLQPGGCFVVEAFVPNPARFHEGQSVRVRTMTSERVALDVAEIDPVSQFMYTTRIDLRDGAIQLHPANHRYAWPTELDLMARIAGLHLENRWQDWDRSAFTATSQFHVSVYRKPGAAASGAKTPPGG
jgi:SAM-dependent methyltransferase